MAITLPNTLSNATTADADDVMENFNELAGKALDKTGDTITGNITVSSSVTIDGRDISADLDQAVKTTSSPTFAAVTISGTGASALDVAGGINAGSGNVGIVNTSGKIPAISSTYFADLSAANLTSIPAANLTGTAAAINGSNITAIAEANITDGTVLARVASNETVSGIWTFGQIRGGVQRITLTGGADNPNVSINSGTLIVVFDISGSDIATISGLSGGAEGRILMLTNKNTSYNVSILEEDSGSTASNRFANSPGGALVPTIVMYDGTDSRWRRLTFWS